MSNGVKNNLSFYADFKNVHLTLVKSAPKKSFAQKPIFLAKIFLGALFTLCIFKSV
jgi:hypothetical protein